MTSVLSLIRWIALYCICTSMLFCKESKFFVFQSLLQKDMPVSGTEGYAYKHMIEPLSTTSVLKEVHTILLR